MFHKFTTVLFSGQHNKNSFVHLLIFSEQFMLDLEPILHFYYNLIYDFVYAFEMYSNI